jgi:serine/threonine protein kinase
MKKEIEHCLQHDVLKQYKICKQCTDIGSVCIRHYKVCPVPSCCFYLCQTLKARLKGRVNHAGSTDNIIFKGPCCSLQGSFIENVHYTVLTPKVVGRGQNGNVCEVHLLTPLVQNAKQQVQKVCLKKCKYRVEEIEVIKILGLHCNVIETLLIVQSSDHMLLFMPQLTCSLLQWKELLHSGKESPSAQDLFIKAYDVASGLVYLHGMGIVHRDIKAANLLLEVDQPRPVVKICDFGHAKCIGISGLSPPCPNCGTQGFRAPEIVRCEPHGFKVDIYSFGVTFLNLSLPFNWQSRWPDDKAKGSIILEYMPDLGHVISQCCHSDVTTRPSAVQLFSLLRQSLM